MPVKKTEENEMKKILSLCLALVMVLACFPTAVGAGC